MTLRRILTSAVMLFAFIIAAGAAILVWSTSALTRTNEAIYRDLERVREANEVALNLFRYRYHTRYWLMELDAEEYRDRERAEDDMTEAMRQLHRDTSRTPMADTVRALDKAIQLYFVQLETAHEKYKSDVNAVMRVADPYFIQVQDELEKVEDQSEAAAARSQAEAADLDVRMNWAGAGMLALGGLLGVILLRVLLHQLYAPAITLRDAMARYRSGDRAARCEVSRPAEFAAIADSVNQLIDQVEEQRSAQMRFLAAVAHDLRNPLTSMKLYCALVRPGRSMPAEDRVRKAFDVVSRQVDILQRMTSDFLDATRIEAGELSMQFADIDLVQIARDAIQLFEEESPRHPLTLEAPHRLEVLGDATRLNQVVVNLISNAIKYSPHGGGVVVRIAGSTREACLSVRDHGIGIDAGELERVFEPFRRSGGFKDNIPGVGLGLSIARRIVAGHGGRIDVESKTGSGSTFTVRLPRLDGGHRGELPPGQEVTSISSPAQQAD